MEVAATNPESARCAILIVEDAIATRAALGELLRMAGYVVCEAADADQARVLLESRMEIDVLITDVEMPGSMDGIGLARWVRRNRPALRVLVLSGLDVASQLAGEGIACFKKPLQSTLLLAALPRAGKDTP